jgi:hypothetical protein
LLALGYSDYSHSSHTGVLLALTPGYSEYSQVGASLAVCASGRGRGHARMRVHCRPLPSRRDASEVAVAFTPALH